MDLLTNEIMPVLRQIVNSEYMQNVLYQQDNRPAHNARNVQKFLRENFSKRVILNNRPAELAARLPNLSLFVFYLCNTTKNKV